MTTRAQILIVLILLIAFAAIIYIVKKRALELKYVLLWLACDIILLIFAIFPGLMDAFSHIFGILSPVNMLFFFGFVFALMIIFSLTVALSRVTGSVRRMAQEMALMEEKFREGNDKQSRECGKREEKNAEDF